MRRYITAGLGVVVLAGLIYFGRLWVNDRFGEKPSEFDEAFTAALTERLEIGYYGDLHSYLIWHDGEMVFEWYAAGYSPERIHPVYSVTKSITSAALGITTEEQEIDLNATLPELFPDYTEAIASDPVRETITLEDLLTMRSGFDWDEISVSFESPRNGVTYLIRSADWVEAMLSHELAHVPGEQFTYNSGVTVLLGEVAASRADQRLDDYVDEQIFAPLGITDWRWSPAPGGVMNAGWGLSLTSPDMVLLGRLFLQGGEWEGDQLIPADWMALSTQTHVTETPWGLHYGFQWWRFPDDHLAVRGLETNDVFFASGLGGQTILMAPHLDVVVVITADEGNNGGDAYPALRDYVFPAAQ